MSSMSRIRTALAMGSLQRRDAPSTISRIAGIHTTRVVRTERKEGDAHTTDSYAKEVDTAPAADASVYRVDPDSDRVQKPHEAPSGYSREGVLHEEYRHVEGAKQPYAPKGGDKGNYGGKPNWAEEHGSETSGKDEGPDAKSGGGRV